MSERILVVDDDARNRRLLDAMLVPEGYDVVEADSGEAALGLLEREPVDLVLLDIMMPGLDGIETLRRIRARPAGGRTLPVVVVTALDDQESRVRGKSVGADDYLAKPVDPDELLARVRVLLDGKLLHDRQVQERLLLERELEQRTRQLVSAERLAMLGTLAGGVGHELNNILTVFESTMFFVRENAASGLPPEKDDLQQLARVGEHLRVHAAHLKSLGRPGQDRVLRFDLRDAVTSVLAMLRTMGRSKYTTVETSLPSEPLWLVASRIRVEQVIMNLVSNAIDACEDAKRRQPRVEVAAWTEHDRVFVAVRDNGIGIPAAKLETIFAPYYTTKADGRGTGLGLVVVKDIVESHGGAIRVRSTPGQGTEMLVELPVEANQPEAPAPSTRPSRTTLRPLSYGGKGGDGGESS